MTKDAAYYRLAMRIFADFGISIAVPAVAASFFGKWLDQRYLTAPRYLIVCFIGAFVLTAFNIWRKSRYYGQEYTRMTKNDSKP